MVPEVLCDNLDLEFSVNASNSTDGCVASNVSYEWSIDDGNGPQITSDVTSVVVPGGNYDELDLVVVASQTSATNTCTAEVAQTVVIQGNPDIAPLSTDVALCPNSSAALSVEVLSDPNGGLTFAWANAGDEWFDFLVAPNGQTVGLTLLAGQATEGDVQLTVTDALGCTAEATTTVDILDLPQPQNIAWSVEALCSNDEVTITMDDPMVDPTLDLSSLMYTWSAFGSNGDNYTVNSDPANYVDVVSNMTLNAAEWPVESHDGGIRIDAQRRHVLLELLVRQ